MSFAMRRNASAAARLRRGSESSDPAGLIDRSKGTVMLRDVPNSVQFPALEERVLARWQRERTFERSLARRADAPRFVFYDGPPFATGLPHYGHILTSFIKDVVPRYQTMRGHHVPRRWGWDCHGLPVELEVEKELGLVSPADLARHGVHA